MGRRVVGRFQATDDINLDGHHVLGMTFLEDLPRGGAGVGQVMVWDGDSWGPQTLTGDGDSFVVTWGDINGVPDVFPPDDHTHPWDEVTDKPTFVNSVSAGTGITVSANTGDVTISITLTAGTNVSVSGATIGVVDAPTFAGVITGESHLVLTGNLDIGGSIAFDPGGAITGATTVTGEEIRSNGNVFVNHDGADGDSYLYFYNGGTPTGAQLRWQDAAERFVFNKALETDGILKVDGYADIAGRAYCRSDANLNYGGPDGDSFLYFYEGSSNTGAHLKWDDTDGRFEFSHGVDFPGIVSSVSASTGINVTTSTGDVTVSVDFTEVASAVHTHSLSALTQTGATTGQVATWDGTGWVPDTVSVSGAVSSVSASTGISVTTSVGDVTVSVSLTAGTYISISGATIAVDSTSVASTAHTHSLSALTQSSATTGQVATWDGTDWVPETPSGTGGGGGAVSSVSAGNGISVTTSTGDVTVSSHVWVIVKRADETRTSDNSWSDDGDFAVELDTNTEYSFELVLFTSGSIPGDMKIRLHQNAGLSDATLKYSPQWSSSFGNAAYDTWDTSHGITLNGVGVTRGGGLYGSIITGTVAGTAVLQWRQTSSSGTPSMIEKGSHWTVRGA